ncbi:unannotated protein [freshwater metagenome]|uniref:Unannotated protein n=1 Tax=freshwater metagenome TaxID=449393 RepID=A0A6J6JG32_9ZZZZ|nr:hypothetical protein [Actinomycetota bacterium]
MSRAALVTRCAVSLVVALALTGCATDVPTPTSSATPPPTSSPQPTSIVAPEDVTAAFREIAYASCDKANAEGVVESGWDGDPNQKTILVPDSEAYKDYSAVFVAANGVLALIWETDSFASCNASNAYSLAEEAGQEAAIDLTFNEADGTYQTVLDQGPDQEAPFVATYTVSNGLIVQQHIDADWGEATIEISYGMPSDEDIAYLRTAVDAFLAEN